MKNKLKPIRKASSKTKVNNNKKEVIYSQKQIKTNLSNDFLPVK